jgi:putative colanic acid biosysnthesis UDP-glucose lipid carrier transferase
MTNNFIPGRLRKNEQWVATLQRLFDAVLIVLAHAMACVLYGEPWRQSMTTAAALGVVLFGLAAEFGGIYRPWRTETISRELRETLVAWVAVPLGLAGFGFVTKTSADYSRGVSFVWFLVTPMLLCASRLVVRIYLRHIRSLGANRRRVGIAGSTEDAERLAAALEHSPWLGLELLGVYDDRTADRRYKSVREDCAVVGTFDDLVERCRQGDIDAVYVALPLRAEARCARLIHSLADTTASVYLVADFFSFSFLRARWGEVGGIPVVGIHDTPFEGVVGWLKRVEDLALGTLILGLIAVPMIAIAVAIKLSSGNPILFRQRRYGLNGKQIRILKFRTMSVCEDGSRVVQARPDDPRVTSRLGRFLRRTSLDELPQFLQVITGELSIVGPRPHAVAHNEEYRSLIDGYMLRHIVKPGITGWAQVNGWRGQTEELGKMQKRVQYDLEYIRDWSLLWDLKIIFLTVFGTKKRQNAC